MAITSLFELLQENITYDLATKAVKAFQLALEVYTHEKNPKEWTRANIGIAFTYHVSTLFIEDKNIRAGLLRDALSLLNSVLISHTSNTTQEEDMFLTTLIQRTKNDLNEIENTE